MDGENLKKEPFFLNEDRLFSYMNMTVAMAVVELGRRQEMQLDIFD